MRDLTDAVRIEPSKRASSPMRSLSARRSCHIRPAAGQFVDRLSTQAVLDERNYLHFDHTAAVAVCQILTGQPEFARRGCT